MKRYQIIYKLDDQPIWAVAYQSDLLHINLKTFKDKE